MKAPESILRRAGPLMAARLAVALLSFAIPMVLARVLLPASYGTFKQAWLLSNTLTFILPMGLTPSLVYFIPREPEKRHLWNSHVLLITTAVGLLAGLILVVLGPHIAALFHNDELRQMMPLVAAFTAFKLAGTSFDIAYMASGRIRESAVIRVGTEGFYTVCLIGGALLTGSLAGAFAGCAMATFARAALCWVVMVRENGLHVSRPDLKRQLAYALPFGAAFALINPQQQFHSYLVSATVSSAAFAIYSVGCFQLPIVDMLYTPVSEILQLGIAEHEARGDNEGALRLFREAVARLAFVFIPVMGLLCVTARTLITFLFTERYVEATPIFRLALISIPMAALPLDGVMRACAQNKFMMRISVLKLVLTVPLVWCGLHLFGPIGALGGWIVAEEACRMIVLNRAARIFGCNLFTVLPPDVAYQAGAALLAAPASAIVLRAASGPLLFQLCLCGTAFAATYLGALRAMGQLPPVREWIPRRTAVVA